jgi:hypothetical protein
MKSGMEPAPICDAMEMGKQRLKMIRDKELEMNVTA